jgi:hypothetical protein
LSQEALSAGMSTEYLNAGIGVESLDIASMLGGLASGIYNAIVTPFKMLGGFISGMIDVIIAPYKMLYKVLKGIANFIVGGLITSFKMFYNTLKNIGSFIIGGLIAPFKLLYNVLKSVGNFIVGGLVTTFKMLYNTASSVINVLKGVGSFIIGGLIAPFKLLYNVLKIVGNFIFDVLMAPFNMLYNIFVGLTSVVSGIMAPLEYFYNTLVNLWDWIGKLNPLNWWSSSKETKKSLKVESAYVGRGAFESNSNLSQEALSSSMIANIEKVTPVKSLEQQFAIGKELGRTCDSIAESNSIFEKNLKTESSYVGRGNSNLSQDALGVSSVTNTNIDKTVKGLEKQFTESNSVLDKNLKTESSYVGRGAFESNSNLSQEALSSSMIANNTNIEKVTPVKSLEQQFAIGKELGRTCDTITESNSVLEKNLKTESSYVGRGAFESNSNLSQETLQKAELEKNTNNLKVDSSYIGRGAFESKSNLSQEALSSSMSSILQVLDPLNIGGTISSLFAKKESSKVDSSYIGRGAFESKSNLSQEVLSSSMSSILQVLDPLNIGGMISSFFVKKEPLKGESGYIGRGAFDSSLIKDVSFDTQMIKSATIEDQFNQSKSSTSMINTGAFGERSVNETKDYDNLQVKMASMASMDYNNVFESIRSEIASKPQGGATRALYITDNGTDEEIDNSTLASNGSGNVDRELFKSFMTTTTNRGVSVGAGMFTPEDAADYVMQQMAGTMPTTSASIAGMEHLTQLAEERNSTLAQILAEMKIANSKNASSNSVNAFFGGSDKKSTEGKRPVTRYKKEILRGNYVDMAAIAANHQDNLATLPR